MNEEPREGTVSADVPEAVVSSKRSFSIVWLIPLVAALIGGWLAYKAYTEKGPTITITFKTAEGLEAGKTKIKYKEVEVGTVENITLSKDLSHVVVTAELVKGAEKYLSAKTRFWVVRARVAAGKVTGLGTLFSGAYIGMEPVKGEEPVYSFKGLEIPPVVTSGEPGRSFLLRADRLGSLDIGSPVYFRQIKVGEVVSYKLDEDGRSVHIEVFVHAPHDQRVHSNTRFWNAGGIDLTVDANGIRLDTESFVSMMIGGIAFDTPMDLEAGGPVKEGHVFKLYKNRRSIYEKSYEDKRYFLLNFKGSVRGLSRGAPVEFRGIKVGKVVDIGLEYREQDVAFYIPVLIQIEPQRIRFIGEETMDPGSRLKKLVEKGLRAQLKTGSLLTGELYVDLDMHPDTPPVQLVKLQGRYPEIPTLPSPLEQITGRLTNIVAKLEKVPIEQIGSDLRDTVQGTRRLMTAPELLETVRALKATLVQTQQLAANVNNDLAPKVSSILDQTEKAVAGVESAINSDSALQYELKRALKELARAAHSLSILADYLERHPDSLIFGKGESR
ncbi:MAG: MCE family protein [Deltaproteobacteria bacterium]|nr:MCE family protein [Deltaproteobacteria bacterium]